MTRWREEKPVPTRLPAARLYFEDIEEIVGILLCAGEKTQVIFQIGNEFCDDIKDLRKIARRTTDLEVSVAGSHYDARFAVNRLITQWTTNGLSREEVWAAFRKLDALFEKRKLRWASLLHGSVMSVALLTFMLALTPFVFMEVVPSGHVPDLVRVIVLPITTILILAIYMGLRHHSIVILHNSWDYAAAQEELRARIVAASVPALIGALLGIGGTILGVYLRHKYWP